ncbi:hypothetical protein [Herbiconiux ginsengi]|uniref:Uncharacterized protein n=1 Tax=Herbiconiux ginsengi TaxID=381665 RepID=A0A1H3SVR1_9MICO|nr:hypothetical protein [Herbiconiux ginsengi]SDZ42062.1 hypothetical protein SAMN05216554_3753 [Herbiconiux ginsengi]
MAEVLHLGALGAAGLGACCVALDGARPRVREVLLALTMVAAMLDVVSGLRLVPVLVWSALTVALALALAVRRRRSSEAPGVGRMRLHSSLGAIVMAGLMLVMGGGRAAAHGHHGSTAPLLLGTLVIAAVVLAAAALPELRRGHILERVQYAAMSASLLMLGGAALG